MNHRFNEAFQQLCATAERGERCPFNWQLPHGALPALARAGKIRVEVFAKNWRVVTIMAGPSAGKHTMRDPSMPLGARPYVVIDAGSQTRGRSTSAPELREPWKPGSPKP